MSDIDLNHASGKSASLLACSAGFWLCPGLNPVKSDASLDVLVSGPADAGKYQNISMARLAKAGPI